MVNFEISCEIKKDLTHYIINRWQRKKLNPSSGNKPLTSGLGLYSLWQEDIFPCPLVFHEISNIFTLLTAEKRVKVIETCDQTRTSRAIFNSSWGCPSLVGVQFVILIVSYCQSQTSVSRDYSCIAGKTNFLSAQKM